MQIRIQGKKVQLIRTEYDPAIKKAKPLPFLSFDIYGAPDAELLNQLSEKDKQQLQGWLDDRKSQREADNKAVYANSAAGFISSIAAAVPMMTPEQALRVWPALDELRKALRKAGHVRPKPAKPEGAAAPAKKRPKKRKPAKRRVQAATVAPASNIEPQDQNPT